MEAVMRVFQAALIDMGVDLRRRNIRVAEHLLDDAQVAAVIEQMAGEAVPQRVRRDVFRDAGAARIFLDEHPDGFSTERLAARRDKHLAETVGFRERTARSLEITLNPFNGLLADRDDAFLVALADRAQEASL